MKILIMLVIISILSGCAVKPTNSIQTNKSLVVSLSGTDKKEYRLVNRYGKVVSRDTGEDKKLKFDIPYKADVNQCYSVLNEKGKYLSDDLYRLSLVNEYRAIDGYKTKLEKLLKNSTEKNESYTSYFENTKNKLERNRAFSDRRCHLPKERPWPREPYSKCGTYDKCLEEGGAICYSRFIGLEGCAFALKELNVSGMLSSPGCAAAAAEIAGEKYDMDDAFVDFLHGVADDVGGELMRSESLLDNILGFFVVGANYGVKLDKARQCTNDFVETHFGPKRRWIEAVNEIRAEPEKTRSQCVSLVHEHNRYMDEINNSSEKVRELSGKIAEIKVVHEHVSNRQIHSPMCSTVDDEKKLLIVNEVKRYLIGANIENYVPDNKKSSVGVKIGSLIDGMPAKLSGLKKGDLVVRVNGNRVKDISSMMRQVQNSGSKALTLSFLRNGGEKSVEIKPRAKLISLVGD